MMAKLLGANYRTTLSNLVALIFATATGIAAAPSELDILPHDLYSYRGRIIMICGVIAFLSRAMNGQFQKDKQVTDEQRTAVQGVLKPGDRLFPVTNIDFPHG